MNLLEAIILGIIQGLTEFLPVSSSGHLEIGNVLLNIQTTDNLLFSIVVHAATALSTIVVFRKDLASLIKDLFKFEWNESVDFVLKIIISMIPIGIIGLLFEKQIESFFTGNLLLVGSMLIFTAILLAFTYLVRHKEGTAVKYWQAIVIGVAQAIAILPGISRSGATIATALLLGVNKAKAARFSFLMVLVPILGASLLKLKDYIEQPVVENQTAGIVLIMGFVMAFFAGLVACKLMINIVKKGKLIYFAIYCAIIGTIAIFSQLI
ncbi:undecaprenyl-diphosphate phosphatase [Marivirga sp. S37H4]|uniref:Undecaprenyl-diphosphatase n=1 Tax=Marivirga aurantiaca TaxID=2802615 RepID=A0A934WX87_9BACT|nr:undecaprenyl-diphosphate phosphatase [Marivirga aurantiaca]MBK6264798.1 undecaprenyl-diphosphate phosphatase [Marivirga aurantiaca]